MVACVPAVELCKYFWFVPDVAKEPTVLVVPAASLSVPLVRVSVLVIDKASAHVMPPVKALIVKGGVNVAPLDVKVEITPYAEYVHIPVPVVTVAACIVKLPNNRGVCVPEAIVIAPVFVMFIVGKFQPTANVIVPVTLPVLSNTAVSCGNGKLLTAGVPPEDVAQPVPFQF